MTVINGIEAGLIISFFCMIIWAVYLLCFEWVATPFNAVLGAALLITLAGFLEGLKKAKSSDG